MQVTRLTLYTKVCKCQNSISEHFHHLALVCKFLILVLHFKSPPHQFLYLSYAHVRKHTLTHTHTHLHFCDIMQLLIEPCNWLLPHKKLEAAGCVCLNPVDYSCTQTSVGAEPVSKYTTREDLPLLCASLNVLFHSFVFIQTFVSHRPTPSRTVFEFGGDKHVVQVQFYPLSQSCSTYNTVFALLSRCHILISSYVKQPTTYSKV